MTIHASKGLEFPVVIAACGFKGRYNQIPAVYLYHDQDDDGRAKLGFSDFAKKAVRFADSSRTRDFSPPTILF